MLRRRDICCVSFQAAGNIGDGYLRRSLLHLRGIASDVCLAVAEVGGYGTLHR